MDPVDLFEKSTAWTAEKIAGATSQLDAETCCDEWNVRTLMDHLVAGHEVFQAGARGEHVGPPKGMPPEVIGDDPVETYRKAREASIDAFRQPGVAEKAAPIIGIGFTDQLVHGWDLAKATGQDTTMPEGLAEAAFGVVGGRLTDDNRGPGKPFKPEVNVPEDASAQDKLLGYLGRTP